MFDSFIHSLRPFGVAVFVRRQLTRSTVKRMFLSGFVVNYFAVSLISSIVFFLSRISSIYKKVRNCWQDPPPRDARLVRRGCGKFALLQEAQAAPIVRPLGMVGSQRIQHLRVVLLEKRI